MSLLRSFEFLQQYLYITSAPPPHHDTLSIFPSPTCTYQQYCINEMVAWNKGPWLMALLDIDNYCNKGLDDHSISW